MAPTTTQEPAARIDQDGACKPLVLLADPLIPKFQSDLSARYHLLPAAGADAAAAASARALLTIDLPAVTADLIDALAALEMVVASSVGVDHVDLAACRRRGIRPPRSRSRRLRPPRRLGGPRRVPARHQGSRSIYYARKLIILLLH